MSEKLVEEDKKKANCNIKKSFYRMYFGNDAEQYVDIYGLNNKNKCCKVLTYIHGGAWRYFGAKWFKFVGNKLARKGYVVLIPNHRKSPRHKHPTHVLDCRNSIVQAIEFLRNNSFVAKEMIMVGASSGGHIGGLLVFDEGYKKSLEKYDIKICGYCSMSGVVSVKWQTDVLKNILNNVFEQGEDCYNVAPVAKLENKVDFPVLCIQGTKDVFVDYNNVIDFVDKFNSINERKAELYVAKGVFKHHIDLILWTMLNFKNGSGKAFINWLKKI